MSYPNTHVSRAYTRKVYRRLLSRSYSWELLASACGFCAAMFAFTLFIMLISAAPAHAGSKLSVPQYAVGVSPQVADLGVVRTITASGLWPDACIPVSATLEEDLAAQLSTLVLRLRVPETLAACAQVATPYNLQVTYTPKVRGVLKVFALTQSGQPFGQNRVITSTSTDPRARVNLTGLWYDPATNGSGLTFIHAYDGSDVVFGTWYVYSADGKPRWYTIQNSAWKNEGQTLEGKLYETAARQCGSNVPVCPPVLDTTKEVGIARVTFNPAFGVIFDRASAEAFSPAGQLLFSSTIQRIDF
jgi:hypothetical protein